MCVLRISTDNTAAHEVSEMVRFVSTFDDRQISSPGHWNSADPEAHVFEHSRTLQLVGYVQEDVFLAVQGAWVVANDADVVPPSSEEPRRVPVFSQALDGRSRDDVVGGFAKGLVDEFV